ncbi:MAG TPA: hypothetical protein VMM80_09095, partial [Bacteroidota bacterium]|nr:hypothetical protein [Bacteroidota bacterium]
MRRSEFLRASVTAALGAAIRRNGAGNGALRRAPAGPPPGPDDGEVFWEFLRGQFPLETERAYLNTGGLGASPRSVIDAVKEKTDELERICET